ncbi:hypothetical protein GCM10010911_62120 [Paenibacillus nasutitermitis]|uniref:Uncharacterized protein n=2 Tax=Paenibacillus nasutitermitis TaxID=1652958 RepID=A0A916ZFT3_9BACL|nr:hypothetical protein GCM10010911_62120 [Paenibacillus nasutitermitis]
MIEMMNRKSGTVTVNGMVYKLLADPDLTGRLLTEGRFQANDCEFSALAVDHEGKQSRIYWILPLVDGVVVNDLDWSDADRVEYL